MNIEYVSYELSPVKVSKNVQFSSKGILLRFDKKRYSTYHPIESLGDLSLKDFMVKLKNLDTYEPVLARVLDSSVTYKDLQPFLKSKIKCYFSAPSIDFILQNEAVISNEGFDLVKLKVSSVSALEKIHNSLSGLNFKFILDFNGKAHVDDFKRGSASLRSFLENRVVYIEDPFRGLHDLSNIKLASDFIDYKGLESYVVIKPTSYNYELPNVSSKISVVTSYLDHPLGQLKAALWALENNIKNHCGLLSHTYYKHNSYSKCIPKSSFFEMSCAYEMFKLLEQENWKQI